jgi:hypothetical protein
MCKVLGMVRDQARCNEPAEPGQKRPFGYVAESSHSAALSS